MALYTYTEESKGDAQIMTFWAIIRDRDEANSNWFFSKIEDCGSKREAQETAKANGYTVRHNRIYTEEEYKMLAQTNYDWE